MWALDLCLHLADGGKPESLAVSIAACAGEPEDGPLALERAEAAWLRATLDVGRQTIGIGSRLEGETRETVVSGEDHARWTIALDTSEITGTMGGHGFGTYPVAETDMDPAYWAEVEATSTGEVLGAVSAAASEAAQAGDVADAAEHLEVLASMARYLGDMASRQAAGDGATAVGACSIEIGLNYRRVSAYQITEARTGTVGGRSGCPSSRNCPQLYNHPSGSLMAGYCIDGYDAHPDHWDLHPNPFPTSNHCRRGKHWSTYVPFSVARWTGPKCWSW